MKWLFLLSLLVVLLEANEQTVKVKGIVTCGNVAQAVSVELWEHDTIDPDDHLKTVKTDRNGKFEISGTTDEITSIEPYILIKHKCQVSNPKCTRHAEYPVPAKFINSKETYDMSIINLALAPKNTEHC